MKFQISIWALILQMAITDYNAATLLSWEVHEKVVFAENAKRPLLETGDDTCGSAILKPEQMGQ
jgi:hypothetical protein